MNNISHIGPKKGWLDVDIKGLWRYRDLYVMYIKRDIVTQYKQTILGPLWYLIQPLFTTVMYMFVFGGLAGISTDGVPQPLFYMAGISLWNYFSSCFSSCSNVFSANAGVFGKVYFPRLVVPLSSCTSNLIKGSIQLFMFALIYIFLVATGRFELRLGLGLGLTSSSSLGLGLGLTSSSSLGLGLGLGLTLSLTLALFFMAGLHAMAWGLLFSSWTTKYRDLNFLLGFGIQLFMYATPVIYPLSVAPEKYRWILNLNPLTPIFEAFKYSTLGVGTFSLSGLLYSLTVLLITMFLAVIIFNRTEQRFMDTV